VVGLAQADAVEKIEDAGLEVEYADAVYSTSVDKGDVVDSDPGPGERILPGDAVTVTLSLGEEVHDLPKLRNLTVDQATDKLTDLKLVVGKVKEDYSEVLPRGRVIGTDPAFGSKKAEDLPVNAVVNLVVSLGREPLKVGDWVGKSFDEAQAKLEARGLEVNVVGHENSDTIAEGDVISHEPTGGTLFKGDKVDFVVSDGPELIEVPAVRYSSTDSAVAELEALGFEVDIERAQIYLSGNTAWDTDPNSGSLAEKGSTIVLYVV
jgi:serine/threonine-protein kinase